LINRLKGLLVTQGVSMRIGKDFLEQLETVRLWDGNPMPAGLRERLARDWAQLQNVETQLREAKAGLTLRQPDAVTRPGARSHSTDIAGDWSHRLVDAGDGDFRLAPDSKRAAVGGAGRVWCHRRIKVARHTMSRASRARQQARPADHGATRLALVVLPAG